MGEKTGYGGRGIEIMTSNLEISRVQNAADTRCRECCSSNLPQAPCTEVDAVFSTRPKGGQTPTRSQKQRYKVSFVGFTQNVHLSPLLIGLPCPFGFCS
jgi:hypothetical protein